MPVIYPLGLSARELGQEQLSDLHSVPALSVLVQLALEHWVPIYKLCRGLGDPRAATDSWVTAVLSSVSISR